MGKVTIRAKFDDCKKAAEAALKVNTGSLKKLVEDGEISVLSIENDDTLPIECDSNHKQTVEHEMRRVGAKIV